MKSLFFIFMLLSILSNSMLISSSTNHTGFAMELIHRDSSRSPFYNPNVTAGDRWKAMHRHSELRFDYFRTIIKSLSSSSSVSLQAARSPVIPSIVSYLMMFKIGDPPVDIWAIIDTGSGMFWIQCLPCLECYRQTAPVFDPKKSTTYRDEPCNTASCNRFPEHNCSSRNVCKYEARYGDGSISIGDVSHESITFLTTDSKNTTFTIQDLLFGCAHENWGQYELEEQGIVGMSMSNNSLISQMGAAVKGRFSTCFVDIDDEHSGSQMLFGDMAVLAGDPTPLAVSSNDTTWYYINLDDISVGKERLNLPPRLFHRDSSGNGGMILDTGAEITYLKREGYDKLVHKLKEVVNFEVIQRTQLCFRASRKDLADWKLPALTFHFDGLDVWLQPSSTWSFMPPSVVCLSMMPRDDFSVFGSLAQQNLHVGYDIWEQKIYMDPADCATFER